MNLNLYFTKNYDNKSDLLTMAKQTQTNPILSASGGADSKGWRCGGKCHGRVFVKSGPEKLCKARDFGMEEYIDCLEENPEKCEFSLPFGEGYLCKCALRIYIAKNLKK